MVDERSIIGSGEKGGNLESVCDLLVKCSTAPPRKVRRMTRWATSIPANFT